MAAVASQMTPPARTQLVHAPDSPMVELFRTCSRIAASEATVLITGETGTGKEVVARLIHARSPRAGKPLIPVNCGAIPETLLESELFGYVKGAFTGAVGNRRGRVAAADGGTLFLDEIGELPLSLQVKLLRVLQERSYEPVGSAESVPANFRLVAATNRDLAAEVEAGRFRRDLYYRLLVCPVEVPGSSRTSWSGSPSARRGPRSGWPTSRTTCAPPAACRQRPPGATRHRWKRLEPARRSGASSAPATKFRSRP